MNIVVRFFFCKLSYFHNIMQYCILINIHIHYTLSLKKISGINEQLLPILNSQ